MKREGLFRKSKPVLRLFTSHEDNELGPDMGILWAAYKSGSFEFGPMDQHTFASFILQRLQGLGVWLMEDENKGFRKGSGPVCIVTIRSNGWKIEPEVHWFSWATKRNKLRCATAFIQKTCYDKSVGCCEFRASEGKLLHHVKKYVPKLRFAGKIWFGTPAGDQFIYSIKGAKHAGSDGRGANAARVQRDSTNQPGSGGSEERESEHSGEDVQSLQERDGNG